MSLLVRQTIRPLTWALLAMAETPVNTDLGLATMAMCMPSLTELFQKQPQQQMLTEQTSPYAKKVK
ncbi:hypothetical protein V7T12_14300 [Segatella copri]|uniref:hypothetical protein n=1 Tax=Segatella copri TaxID=165179 RepID=UPI002FEFF262